MTAEAPVLGLVLIGGASRRMGRPKHRLEVGGRTLLARAVDALAPHVAEVWLSGPGEVPAEHAHLPRLADPPGLRGPLAGLVAAARHRPDACWVAVACDLPRVTPDAVAWLLAQRRSGVAAVLPTTPDGRVQPLLALYEPAAAPLVEALAASARPAPTRLAGEPGVATPAAPEALAAAWTNVNTAEELAAVDPGAGDDRGSNVASPRRPR